MHFLPAAAVAGFFNGWGRGLMKISHTQPAQIPQNLEEIKNIINDSLLWMSSKNLSSFDPYDLQSTRIFIHFEQNSHRFTRFCLYPFYFLNLYAPRLLRIFFEKTKAATTSALFAHSCLLWYYYTRNSPCLDLALRELHWLDEHASKGYSGYCWGLPFDWYMGDMVIAPKGTPFSTIMIYMIDAFSLGYRITGDSKYRNIVESSSCFFLHDLRQEVIDHQTISLSYSPLDTFNVVNVNSYAAASLLKANGFRKNPDIDEFVSKLIHYVISKQNIDGSWNYWDPQKRENSMIDSLHQCYILQNLYRCSLYKDDPSIIESIRRGFTFFMENFYQDGRIYKYSKNSYKKMHPPELIDAAETIYTLTLLSPLLEVNNYLEKVVRFSLDNFKSENKPFFFSKMRRLQFLDIPYMRWGEAQMVHALITYYLIRNDALTVKEYLMR